MLTKFTNANMATETIAARVPEELVRELEDTAKAWGDDKSTIIKLALKRGLQQLSLENALELYRKGKVTMWKAATLAHLTLWEFIDELKRRKIPLPYTLEEAKQDIREVFG